MSHRTYRPDDHPYTVYLLHFEPAYRHARHYVGSTETRLLPSRLARHARGQGARLVRAALAAGCKITLTKVWHTPTRELEKKIKRAGHHKAKCPLCNPGLTTDMIAAMIPIPNQVPIAATWGAAEWSNRKPGKA
jgi:hypothetical protein